MDAPLHLALIHWLRFNDSAHTVWARQADSGFVGVLAEVRAGALTPAAAAALQRRCARPLDTTDGILPTKACFGACPEWEHEPVHTHPASLHSCPCNHVGRRALAHVATQACSLGMEVAERHVPVRKNRQGHLLRA